MRSVSIIYVHCADEVFHVASAKAGYLVGQSGLRSEHSCWLGACTPSVV